MNAAFMTSPMSIDPKTGAILIGDTVRLTPYQSISSIQPLVVPWLTQAEDHSNGHETLSLRDLEFGGHPAGLGLSFHKGHLAGAQWSVMLPDALMESGWPTREAIDAEVAFMRIALAKAMGKSQPQQRIIRRWGELSSVFDERAFIALSRLRYRRWFLF